MAKQVVTSIRVDEQLWKQAKIYAIKSDVTISEFLERLLKEELKHTRSNE